MFYEAKEAIEYIEKCKRRKYNISSLISLLNKHNNFHLSLKCVHVGGTNGKGSTTHFISSVLKYSGYKTGSFTSPYLICHNDRIRIDNEYISDDDFLNIVNQFYQDFEEYQLSFFEMDTFIALYYFYINKVDLAVIEVGLGGRLDATNVIIPLISVVVNIGMDHMEYLGNTLELIAFEKAGIIKENIPFYTMENKSECLDVFKKTCEERNAQFNKVNEPNRIKINNDITTFDFEGDNYTIKGTTTYQPLNASLAISVCKRLIKLGWNKISLNTIKEGIYNCFWLGRFEKLSVSPLIFIDGAHNAPGIRVLCDTLNIYKEQGYHIRIIFSALKDKEYSIMLKELLTVSDDITVTQFDFASSRATDVKTLVGDLGLRTNENWQELYYQTLEINDDKILTIFTGSLYFVSEVRALHKRGGR